MGTASGATPAAQLRLHAASEDKLLARRALAADLYRRLLTEQEVAERIGCSLSTVRRDLAALNVPRRRRGPRVNELDKRRIAKRRREVAHRYLAGETLEEIAHALGVSTRPVRCDLIAQGIVRRLGAPPRIHPEPCERQCAYCGRQFTPTAVQVAAGYGQTCSDPCKTLNRWWRTGKGISDVLLANAQAWAGDKQLTRRFKGRWAGRKGGRPRDPVTPDQYEHVRRLRAIGRGRPAIVAATGLTDDVVRRVVSEIDSRAEQLTL